MLSIGEKIRVILKRRNMKVSDLARILNTSPANLSGKLARDNFSEKEAREIAAALDCEFEGVFKLKSSEEMI